MRTPALYPVVLCASTFLLLACSDHRGVFTRSGVLRNVAFETRSEIGVATGDLADVATADFNSDGNVDIVATSIAGRVQVLLGQGNGVFNLAQSLDAPGIPAFVGAGDLDRDGDQDFVVVRSEAQRATTYANDGRGNFAVLSDAAVGPGPQELVVADVDGDGVLDACTTSLADHTVSFLRGRGDGTFQATTGWSMPVGSQPLGIGVGDLDGDGHKDVVASDLAGRRIGIFYGRGQGSFDAPLMLDAGAAPVAVTIGDISHDGLPDIVVSNLDDASLTILRRVDLRSYRAETVRTDGSPSLSAVGDLTGDGVNDLVVSVFSRASVSIYPGRSNGGLGDELQLGMSGLPLRPLIVSVNSGQDAIPDLVVSSVLGDRLSLVFGSEGLPVGSLNYAAGVPIAEAVATADFDGDGVAELAAGGAGAAQVVISSLNDSPATRTRVLTPMLRLDTPAPPFNLVAADFNRDGRVDLAAAMAGGVVVFANRMDGDGLRFRRVPETGFLIPAAGAFEIGAGDLDGDGLLDIVISSVADDKVKLLRAVSTEFEYDTSAQEIAVSGGPLGLALADYDGDGDLDVAVSRNLTGFVNVYANDGRGSMSILAEIPVGVAPNYLRTTDFDGDGRADLVVSNGLSDNISVLLAGPRPGSFAQQDIRVGDRPTALLTRDLNRDGAADILVASLLGADFFVLLGDGGGGFPTQTRFPGTYLATTADLADLNADGLPDLAVGSARTTRVSLYRNISR